MRFIESANERRIAGIASAVCRLMPVGVRRVLDVGCGNGSLAKRISEQRPGLEFEGVEVVLPVEQRVPMQCYDGTVLPFPDGSFDAILCADMLHHTASPAAVLLEACRVARECVIVKDHICDTIPDRVILTCMDWLGNAGTGVPLPFRFLSTQQWSDLFVTLPYNEVDRIEGLQYWGWPMRNVFDRRFHFVAVLQRTSSKNN
jgi:ubiquinone/menaquinone biosynthesis C-methylase UbiE